MPANLVILSPWRIAWASDLLKDTAYKSKVKGFKLG